MFCMLNPVIMGEMNGAATRFLSYRSLARPSSLDCARMDGFILICLTTNRWCAARAMSEYIPHIYILHKDIMNFLCQSGMSFARFHLKPGTAHWQMNKRRNGASGPWCFLERMLEGFSCLASDRPLSESTDAGDPPKRVGSNEASNLFLLAMLDFGTVKQTLCFILSKQNQRKVTTT